MKETKIKTITIYYHIYMEFRKMLMITLYAEQKKKDTDL